MLPSESEPSEGRHRAALVASDERTLCVCRRPEGSGAVWTTGISVGQTIRSPFHELGGCTKTAVI